MNPSRSRSASARATVFGLIRRKPASWRTVGSWVPGLRVPVEMKCRIWVISCACTGTALFGFTRSPDGGSTRHASRDISGLGRRPSGALPLGGATRQPPAHPDQAESDSHPQRLAAARQIPDKIRLGGDSASLPQPIPRNLLFDMEVHLPSPPFGLPARLTLTHRNN